MARIVRTEHYRRGVFGWLFLILFIAFNAYMAVVIGSTIWITSQHAPKDVMLTEPGVALGLTLGFGVFLFIWALGAFILGMLAYFTRGKKVIIEDTQ